MTEPSLRTHFQSLVAEGREVEAVTQLKTLIQSLPDQNEKSGIHLLLLERPIPWEQVLERLGQAWGTLNPTQAQDYTTIIGHDNVALSKIFNSIIQINLGKTPASGPHFLTLDHPAVKSTVIGRQVELQYLEQLMAAPEKSPVVIWGASGIGKTLLAELYWEKHKGEYAVLGWLNYHTSLANTIVTEIMPQYADYPDLDKVYDKKLEWTAKKYILHELQNRAGKKLVVLNNVPLGSDVAARLEWLNNIPDLQLLITANDALEGTRSYALPPLSEEEIVDLFKVLSGQEVDADTAGLLGQLGQNALLTRLIARNIPAADLNSAKKIIQHLYTALENEGEEVWSAEQRLLISLLDFSLQDAAERWVLLQFAAMPAMELELGYFKALVLPDWSEGDVFDVEGLQHYLEDQEAESAHRDLEGILEALGEKGWLEMVEDRYVLPEAVRMAVELHYESYAAYFVELVESLHLSYFGEEFGKVKGNALFVAHLKGLLPYLEYGEVYLGVHRLLIKTLNDLVNWGEEEKELTDLLKEVEQAEGKYNEIFWKVAHDLSECCRRLGSLESANHFSSLQLDIAKKIYTNYSNLAIAQNERGSVLYDLGDYSNAFELLKMGLNNVMRDSKPDLLTLSATQSNMALLYLNLGKFSDARDLYTQALESVVLNFGVDHFSISTYKCNLSASFMHLGDYSNAMELAEQALEDDLRNFGSKHPNVARSQSNLAAVYMDLGDYSRAKELLELALASDFENFGQNHPHVARSQSILAKTLTRLAHYPRAVQLLEKALESDLSNFDQNHPHVARSQSNLALSLIELGEYSRAMELLEKALESDLSNFESGHPNITRSQSNLANILIHLGDYPSAAQLLEKALDANLQNFEPDHPIVTGNQSDLATALIHLGEYTNATHLLEKALDANLRKFGPDHPVVAINYSNLAAVYNDLGEYAQAVQLLEIALDINLRRFGPDHPIVATTQLNLATPIANLGEFSRSIALLQLAMDVYLRKFGPDHPNISWSQSNLAMVYCDLADYRQAVELLEQAIESELRNFGPEHPNVAIYKSYLAKVYQHQNRLPEALILIQEALIIFEQKFSKHHQSYLKALKTQTEIQDLIQAQSAEPSDTK